MDGQKRSAGSKDIECYCNRKSSSHYCETAHSLMDIREDCYSEVSLLGSQHLPLWRQGSTTAHVAHIYASSCRLLSPGEVSSLAPFYCTQYRCVQDHGSLGRWPRVEFEAVHPDTMTDPDGHPFPRLLHITPDHISFPFHGLRDRRWDHW